MEKDEQILGIIPNTHTGLFGNKCFNLIITNKRLVAASLTSEMLKEAAKKRSEESKNRGEGFLKRWASTMFSGVEYYKKYYDMQINDILSENQENFVLEPSMVNKIKIKTGHFNEAQEKTMPHELIIKSTNGKHKFNFSNISPKEAKNLLSKTFGATVK